MCGPVRVDVGAPNGLLPDDALCELPLSGFRLRSDAAEAWWRLSVRYDDALGRPLCVTDAYRTLDAQVRLSSVKPTLAARPGTSNHGWGIALDLCGGAESFDSTEYRWLLANAGRAGWSNPPWARRDGSRPEPWHWEYDAPTRLDD